MMEKIDHQKDFIESLSELTGIPNMKLAEYIKTSNILNILEHPNVLEIDERQQEKIRLLNQFYSSYRVLQDIESNNKICFKNPDDIGNYFLSMLSTMKEKEMFFAAYLDNGNNLIETRSISGFIDSVQVYPRDVMKDALNCDCKSIIFAHNHPGGSRKFSDEDVKLTEKFINLFKPLGIRILDHILIANYSYTSMIEAGKFPLTPDQSVVILPVETNKNENLSEIQFITSAEASKIIQEYKPEGKFILLDMKTSKPLWIAIDNSSGDAWTEEFSSLERACHYLIGLDRFIANQPHIEKLADDYINSHNLSRVDINYTEWFAEKVIMLTKHDAEILFKNEIAEIFCIDDQEHEALLEEQEQLSQYERFVIEKNSLEGLDRHVKLLMSQGATDVAYKIIANYCISCAQEGSEPNAIISFDELEEHFKIKLTEVDNNHILTAIGSRIETADVSNDGEFYVTLYTNYCHDNDEELEM